MKRSKRKIKNMILFAVFSMIFIAIGYAVLSTNLNISGMFNIAKATWDVHFESIVESEENTVSGTYTLEENNTKLSYTASLKNPGDIYTIFVEVANDGTIDAMLNDFTYEDLTEEQKVNLEYTIKYADGEVPVKNDQLKAKNSETFAITIKYREDITIDQLPNERITVNLSFTLPYIQDNGESNPRIFTLYSTIKANAVLDNISSNYVTAETGIDFSQASSDTNGRGVYELNNTSNDAYPIYYYRGDVDNNNVIFGKFCWKIVRTTDTGGTKLLYNGSPDENGKCTATGDDVLTETAAYGSDVNYTSSSSTSVGSKVNNWYENNLIDFASYIENTVYCNDTTLATNTETNTEDYAAAIRKKVAPTLACTKEDSFTIQDDNNNGNGNGKLNYPIALITMDELIYGGLKYYSKEDDFKNYLLSDVNYWTMTPATKQNISPVYRGAKVVIVNGSFKSFMDLTGVTAILGIRPVISLKNSCEIKKGTGTSSNPYIINTNISK